MTVPTSSSTEARHIFCAVAKKIDEDFMSLISAQHLV